MKQRCGGKILIHYDDADGLNNVEINLTPYMMEKTYRIRSRFKNRR